MRVLGAVAITAHLLLASAFVVAAQDDTLKPVGFGGRVEVPEAGFALTLPADEWAHLRPRAADSSIPLTDAEARVEPWLSVMAEEYDEGGGSPLSLIGLRMTETSVIDEVCSVRTDATAGKSADYFAAMTLAGLRDLEWRTDLSVQSLPMGEVPRIYWDDYPATPVTAAAIWFFVDGDTVHYLTCMGEDRNEDGWSAIAQSFEFLPDE